ncbi:MAG TPA: helix-turn-helix domain-containing protein [Alcaligenes sp.]|nr:helix-turn-helix domain-containing protein [Alcaligenes sp.]HRL26923.1 helix-turn-helix domain-containing protein [Alcaligenes sp.]
MTKVSKDHIVDVAAQLVRERGFNGVSMSDIAKAVGLQKASLYSHFANKEQLVSLALQRVLDELLAASVLTGEALRDFETIVGQMSKLLSSTRRCIGFHLLYGLDLSLTDVPVKHFFVVLEAHLMAALMQAPQVGQPAARAVARDAVACLEGASIWLLVDDDVNAMERALGRACDAAQRALAQGAQTAPQDRLLLLEGENARLRQEAAEQERRLARLESMVEADSCFRSFD